MLSRKGKKASELSATPLRSIQPFPLLFGTEPFWDLAEVGFPSPEFGRGDVVLQIDVDGVDFFRALEALGEFHA